MRPPITNRIGTAKEIKGRPPTALYHVSRRDYTRPKLGHQGFFFFPAGLGGLYVFEAPLVCLNFFHVVPAWTSELGMAGITSIARAVTITENLMNFIKITPLHNSIVMGLIPAVTLAIEPQSATQVSRENHHFNDVNNAIARYGRREHLH